MSVTPLLNGGFSKTVRTRPARDAIPAASPRGSAVLELSRVAGATVVTRAQAASPLRLLLPRTGKKSAWVFTGTLGGGLVSGDDIRLDVRLGAETTCLLSTQASTKIYRCLEGEVCRQTLHVSAADAAICVAAPDPVICFTGARFIQNQRFNLAPSASLVLVDWLTSGRRAAGERWAFAGYESRIDIFVGERHVLHDAQRLCPEDGPLDTLFRMGAVDCLAVAVILGPAAQGATTRLLQFVQDQPPPPRGSPLLFAASPLAGGALLRVAGSSSETVGRWLRDRLDFVPALFGEDPWARKW